MSTKSRVSRRKFIGGMVAIGGAAGVQQPTGGIRGFDHVALPMQNTDVMIAFYRSLGLQVAEKRCLLEQAPRSRKGQSHDRAAVAPPVRASTCEILTVIF
jgi:hypothetical protein